MSTVSQSRIAAFFDLDGTLIPKPSLEYHFFVWLSRHGAIPFRNYCAWLANSARLAPRGLTAIRHANKLYLRGLSLDVLKTAAQLRSPRIAAPQLLSGGLDRIAWHAECGHAIFLITGTLEPLASEIARALAIVLALRGITTSIALCATRLQEQHGVWTGRIEGEPMHGLAKVRTVLRLAADMNLDLPHSYAYGDSFSDRDMLESVGHPSAVNPSPRLRRYAARRSWPVLAWTSTANAISSAKVRTPPCGSDPLFGPESFRQHEQDSTLEKLA